MDHKGSADILASMNLLHSYEAADDDPEQEDVEEEDDEDEEFGAPPRRRKGKKSRAAKPKKETVQYTHHGWDEGALKRLCEGLERSGLDFTRVAEHVGQRSLKNVRSRAVKQLESWDRDGSPLPPKVTAMGGLKAARQAVQANTDIADWADLEVSLLESGLRKYGLDWAAISAHVATRDSGGVKVKAIEVLERFQKKGPMPAKVTEMGGLEAARSNWGGMGHWTAEVDKRLQQAVLL